MCRISPALASSHLPDGQPTRRIAAAVRTDVSRSIRLEVLVLCWDYALVWSFRFSRSDRTPHSPHTLAPSISCALCIQAKPVRPPSLAMDVTARMCLRKPCEAPLFGLPAVLSRCASENAMRSMPPRPHNETLLARDVDAHRQYCKYFSFYSLSHIPFFWLSFVVETYPHPDILACRCGNTRNALSPNLHCTIGLPLCQSTNSLLLVETTTQPANELAAARSGYLPIHQRTHSPNSTTRVHICNSPRSVIPQTLNSCL